MFKNNFWINVDMYFHTVHYAWKFFNIFMYNGHKICRIVLIFLQKSYFVANHIKIETEQKENDYTKYHIDCILIAMRALFSVVFFYFCLKLENF
jgi:hypothetical protein